MISSILSAAQLFSAVQVTVPNSAADWKLEWDANYHWRLFVMSFHYSSDDSLSPRWCENAFTFPGGVQ